MQKLVGYALNTKSDEGAPKAHVFEPVLGIKIEHAHVLFEALQNAARTYNADIGKLDQYGQRYVVDFPLDGLNGRTANVRSPWIVRPNEDFARLFSCYVLKKELQ